VLDSPGLVVTLVAAPAGTSPGCRCRGLLRHQRPALGPAPPARGGGVRLPALPAAPRGAAEAVVVFMACAPYILKSIKFLISNCFLNNYSIIF